MLEETIPILDLAPYPANEPGADHRLAEQLRRASENIGFYFIRNHGVGTNRRFRSTPHRAINRASVDRYAIPFVYDPNTDVLIECLPGCSGPDKPPRHPPRTFADYYVWFLKMNYPHQADR